MIEFETKQFDEIVEFPPKVILEKRKEYCHIPMEDIVPDIKYAKAFKVRKYTGGGARFKNGDTIFARITPCLEHGKIAKVKDLSTELGFGSTEYFVFRAKENISDSDFIYYLSSSDSIKQPAIKSMTGASGRQRANKDVVGNLKVKIPKLDYQKRIVSVLNPYDDLIENNLRRIELLEESARLLYREWFVHLRFPGHEHTKITKGVPEGWEKGVIADYYNTSSGGTPSRKRPEYFEGNIKWVKTQELNNQFIIDTQEKITEEAVKKSSAKEFSKYTVLIAMYGATIGQLGILADSATSNQACCALISRNNDVNHIYAYLFLRENKKKILNLSMGAAQKNINQQIIRDLKMLKPSKTIMDSFFEFVNPLFEMILNLQRQRIELIKARDILLPRLMNGDIIV